MQVHHSSSTQERRSGNSREQHSNDASGTRSQSNLSDDTQGVGGDQNRKQSQRAQESGPSQQGARLSAKGQQAPRQGTSTQQDSSSVGFRGDGSQKHASSDSSSTQQGQRAGQAKDTNQRSAAPGVEGAQENTTASLPRDSGGADQESSRLTQARPPAQQSPTSGRSQLYRGDYLESDLESQRPDSDQRDLTSPLLGGYTNIDDDKPTAGGPPGPDANSNAKKVITSLSPQPTSQTL